MTDRNSSLDAVNIIIAYCLQGTYDDDDSDDDMGFKVAGHLRHIGATA